MSGASKKLITPLTRPCVRAFRSRFAGIRRLLTARPPHKFTTAVWANEVHLLGATLAICAFVSANVCRSTSCKCSSAFFALFLVVMSLVFHRLDVTATATVCSILSLCVNYKPTTLKSPFVFVRLDHVAGRSMRDFNFRPVHRVG